MIISCKQCEKLIQETRSDTMFCSPLCSMAWRRKNTPERIRELNSESYFRHREKRLAEMREYKKSNSIAYATMKRASYIKTKYDGQWKLTLERDNFTCTRKDCGSTIDLVVHHFNLNKED